MSHSMQLVPIGIVAAPQGNTTNLYNYLKPHQKIICV